MVATWTTPGVGWASSTDAITYTSGTITPNGNGEAVFMAVELDGNTATDWVMSDSRGGVWSKVGRALFNASADFLELWVRETPDESPANTYTVTFSHAAGTATGSTARVLRLSGISDWGLALIRKGAGDVLQVVNVDNQAGGGTPAATLPEAIRVSSGALMAIGAVANPPAVTAPPATGWARVVDTGHTAPAEGLDVMRKNGGLGGGSATVTCGGTSAAAFGVLLVEVDGTFVVYDRPRVPRRIGHRGPFLRAPERDTSATAAGTVGISSDARSSGRQDAASSLTISVRSDARGAGRQDAAAKLSIPVRADMRSAGRQDLVASRGVSISSDARSAGRMDVAAARGVPAISDARSQGRQDAAAKLSIPVRSDARGAGREDARVSITIIARTDARTSGRQDLVAAVSAGAGTVPIVSDARSSGRQDARVTLTIVARSDARTAGRSDAAARLTIPARSDARARGRSEAAAFLTITARSDARGRARGEFLADVAAPATAAEHVPGATTSENPASVGSREALAEWAGGELAGGSGSREAVPAAVTGDAS